MAKQLKKIFSTLDEIEQGRTINSWHVSQTVDAFTGAEDYDISILGSLSVKGKLLLDLTQPSSSSVIPPKYLVLDPITNEVYTVNSSSGIYPLQINPLTRTAWNNGKGDLNNNTNFGYFSFIRNITGDNNTIYGSNNANGNTSGSGNTIIGTRNVNVSTNANNIIAIGNQVLFNTEYGDNIGVGLKVLYNLKYGANNIGIGNYTLYSSISGDNNLAMGDYAASKNKGSNNITFGHYALENDENGSNRVTLGTFAGREIGDGWLEIHSYSSSDDTSAPLILGHFNNRWLKINGNFRLDINENPSTDVNLTPNQLLFDGDGKSYIMPRAYTKEETDLKFQNGDNEFITTLDQPVLEGNLLTIKYTGEDGIQQNQTVQFPENVDDKNYTHDQRTPAEVWDIVHNLNKKPSITVTDTAGTLVEGSVTINSLNSITISFNGAFSGYAELN